MSQSNPLVTSAVQTTIANLYLAIFGRNPDPGGFAFWTNRLAESGNTSAAAAEIARGFAGSREFISIYGNQDPTNAIDLMYANVLNRPADSGGLTYWAGEARALIASGLLPEDALALTAMRIITTAASNNTPDTVFINARQATAIAVGSGTAEALPVIPPVVVPPVVDDGGGDEGGGGAPTLSLTGSYIFGHFTIATPVAITGAVTVSASGVLATTDSAATVTQPVEFDQSDLTTFSLAGLTATEGTTSNFVATVSTDLSEITGSASADIFIFATNAFGRANDLGGTTVDGGLGDDTVALTTQAGAFTVFSNTANQQNIAGIENIVLTAGNGAALTLDNSVSSANNGSVVNVRNASTTVGSTVNLGAGAAHTYTSASSGNDTVTLGLTGQQVTLSGGGTDTVNTTVAASLGSSFTGSTAGTSETLTFTGTAGTINLGPAANGTTMAISNIDRINLAAGANIVNITPTAGNFITINAAAAGGALTTINGTGHEITVLQGASAADALAFSGSAGFNVSGGTLGAAITSTGSGALHVSANTAGSTITSASATTVAANPILNAELVVAGAGNFTITNFGAQAGAVLRNTAEHLGTTSVITGAFASSIATTSTSGALTVNAGLLAGALGVIAGSTGAITVNGLSLAGSTVTFANTADTISATITGTDAQSRTITTGAGADNITISNTTGNGIQTISSHGGDDVIDLLGTTGANVINGGGGNDTIRGGSGDDLITGGAGADSLRGWDGDDVFRFISGAELNEDTLVVGDVGANSIEITAADLTIVDVDFTDVRNIQTLALTGASTAVLGAAAVTAGITTVDTGTGNTSLTATNLVSLTVVSDVADASTLNLAGDDVNYIVTGLVADLTVADAHTGSVTVTTGSAATVSVGFGTNVTGTHSVNADALTDGQVLTLTGTDEAAVTLTLGDLSAAAYVGYLTVTATTGTNIITTGSGNDTIDGGNGNDTITGGAGADSLTGGAGVDLFLFNTGDVVTGETIDGGTDMNTIRVVTSTDFSDLTTATILTAGAIQNIQITGMTTGTFLGSQLTGQAINVNYFDGGLFSTLDVDVVGTAAVDLTTLTFTATADGNSFVSGNDIVDIDGDVANNTITGTTLADNIAGNDGDDTIDGGAGNDTITGGAGADIINVGTGLDVVVIGTVATANIDVITGFTNDDTISFVAAASYRRDSNNLDDFATLDLALADVVSGWSGNPQPAAMGFTYRGNTYVVVDGNRSGVYEASFDGVAQLIGTDLASLSAANFVA